MNYGTKIAEYWVEEAKEGRIFWHDELTPELGFYIAAQLDRCERDKNIEAVTLDISSRGGNGNAMWLLVDRIRNMDTPVTTVCSSVAMSAGFVVLAAGKTRKATRHSELLFHGSLHSQCWQKSPENTDTAESQARFDAMMCDFLGEVTKKRASHWKKLVAEVKDRYVTPEEALEWGVVDELSK